jgi:hypothetical protein
VPPVVNKLKSSRACNCTSKQNEIDFVQCRSHAIYFIKYNFYANDYFNQFSFSEFEKNGSRIYTCMLTSSEVEMSGLADDR